MTRDIASGTANASEQDEIIPVVLCKIEFNSGDVLVHSQLGDLTYDGDTYTGIGRFGAISEAEETADLSRTPINLTMSGIPNDILSIVLGFNFFGDGVRDWLDPKAGVR